MSETQSKTPDDARADGDPVWEALEADAAIALVHSGRLGLSAKAAAERLQRFGPNTLPEAPRRSPFLRFAQQFDSLLIYVLVGAAALSAILGHWLDTAVIMAVVICNAAIAFYQEGRAQHAFEAVSRLLANTCVAMRDGHRATLRAAELVPGDVVAVSSGDNVPADLRLIDVHGLVVDEAILTGESVPVAKRVAPVAAGLALAERASMAFSGTTVASGSALGLAIATGRSTEIGKIGRLTETVGPTATPLLERLSAIGKQLTIIILIATVVIFAIGWVFERMPLSDLFMAAVGVSVAAIPEGLPTIVTVILAIGVLRMAARGAIIRRLPAVETLGSVTVICTDKTGTLTRNELVARCVVTAEHAYGVEGEGYGPDGDVLNLGSGGKAGATDVVFAELVRAAALCNDAELTYRDGTWAVEGDPLEGGLLALATKAGFDRAALATTHPRLDAIPFESDSKYMATLHRHADSPLIVVKGAPERLIELCAHERAADGNRPINRQVWHDRVTKLASDGLRVLAFASARHPTDIPFGHETVAKNLVLLGLVGFIDPPRAEAAAAVAECKSAGIAVKMVTGDHAATALAVAKDIGIDVSTGALTGSELTVLTDADLVEAAVRVNVFARVDPGHKLRLVTALQSAGNSVAMTGDGVNDAPALRRADIGVAMGRKGSDAARAAAQMVLVDDDFATIGRAVRVGRTIDDNLRKSLAFVLPTNAGEALVIVAALFFGGVLPITAIQIIWINFATEVTLSLALAFEPPARNVMGRPPRGRRDPLIDRRGIAGIAIISVLMAILASGLFHLVLGGGAGIETARALAVNALVASEAGYLMAVGTLWRRDRDGRAHWNRAIPVALLVVVLLQLGFTQWLPVAAVFGVAPLGLMAWALVILTGLATFLVGRALKTDRE